MSTLTIPDVRRCDPGGVEQVAQQLRREQSRMLQVLAVLIMRRVFRVAWAGPGADAATARYDVLSGRVRDAVAALDTSAACLDTTGTQLRLATSMLGRAGEMAMQQGGFVDEWGQLHMPTPAVGLDPAYLAVRARLEGLLRAEVEALVGRVLVLARSADDALAQALLSIANGGSSSGATGALAGGGALTPPPAAAGPLGAYESAAWWTSLTPAQKRGVLVEHPEWVGPRDGIPAADRHTANLVLLAGLEAQAEQRLREAKHVAVVVGHVDERPARERLAELPARERLAELRVVRDVLARRDGGDRALLLIDGSGQLLKAAVSVGDVDTAEHVATFVGGFTTRVGGDLGRYDRTFTRMKSKARSFQRGELAVVTWLGYPAPQYGGALVPGRTVLGHGLAQGHSDELAKFANGIDASREEAVHQTVLAHSYGTVVVGNALLKAHSFSDVAVFGAPGLPFSSVAQAGLKPGGLNVLRAKSDPIAAMGPFVHGQVAEAVAGSVWLSTEASKDSVNTWRASGGHSEYLESDTTSERNLLAIAMLRDDLTVVAGHGERTSHFSAERIASSVGVPVTRETVWGRRPGPTRQPMSDLAASPMR